MENKEEKLEKITEALKGTSYFDWLRIKQAVDSYYNARINEAKRDINFEDSQLFKNYTKWI